MPNPYCIRRESGAALVISLLMLTVLLLVGSGSLTTSRIETQITGNDEKVKQALLAAEYAMALGENTVEQAARQLDLDFGQVTGRYNMKTQPKWDDCKWDDRDSIDIVAYFADPTNPLPSDLPPLPPTLQDAHDRPRLMIEEKHFAPHSLAIGIKPQAGIWYFNVAAHGGRAKWTPTEKPGATDLDITYNDRYQGTRVVLQSVYAKRYN